MAKMADADLADLVKRRRDASVKHQTDTHAANRREALKFYRGDNDTVYGPMTEGMSSVVSRDLYEAVESILPGLVKPFVAGDEAVRFEPTLPDDEEPAKQATEYINYLFANHNSAFRVTYDFAKDGLMFRLGVMKVVYEMVDDIEVETLKGLSEIQYQALDAMVRQDKTKEILDDPVQEADGTITCRVKSQTSRGTYRTYVIAPDEFLYEDRISALDEADFLGHKPSGGRSVGDLIALGLDKKKCMDLQGLDPPTLESQDRYGWDEFEEQYDDDDLARKVTVSDCYIKVDYEGNGSLQWRQVVLAGADDTILLNEPVEDHPFVVWTPIPIPHKLAGQSIHDTTRDIQMQKTALTREGLNALYLANRPQRGVVDGQVNIEDLLNPSVGGIVRAKSKDAIWPIETGGEGVAAQSLQMVEYLDTVREQRTGSTRYNQGMDANSLNKTATGISIIQNASTQRSEMVARQLAEAMKQVFQKMLMLVSLYADKAEVIRINGQWTEMDPREWKTSYDMTVSVGLGTGNKDQMAAHLTNLMGVQEQIVKGQGGVNGPIVFWENIYEAAKKLPENMGLQAAERYFTDPAKAQQQDQQGQGAPPPPPGPPQLDPMVEMQAKNALELQKAYIDQKTKVEVAAINADATVRAAGLQVPPEIIPILQQLAGQGGPQAPQEPQPPQMAPQPPQQPAFAPGGPPAGPQGPMPGPMPDELGGDMA